MADHIFMKNVPVTIVQAGHETRKVSVCVAVDIEYITSPVARKVVVVRLTDEKDLLFLYHMRMTEDEYRKFKEEKRLVFGFDEFPQILTDYLDCCIEQDCDDDRELFAQLSFQGSDRAEFHVMQFIKLPVSDRMSKSVSKNVKRDSILPLDLLRGNDSDVKCYLAVCIRNFQDHNTALQRQLSDVESDLADTRAALAARCKELSNVTNDWTSKLNEVSARSNDELNAERQKLLQMQTNIQQKFDRERKEIEQAHLKIVKEFEQRVHELELSNRDLTDVKYKSESTIRDLTLKVSALEIENDRMRSDLQSIRTDYSAMGSDRSEQERELTNIKLKVAVLEQDMKVKEEQLKRLTDELSFERDTKKKVEEEMERKRRHLREQAAIIKDKANDINKANEIIAKLQNDNMAYHSEVKVRRMTIVEQEKVMNEKVQQLEELKHDLNAAQSAVKQKESELHDVKEKLDECLGKLRESREKIKENENVIQYLSRNMTEMQLGQQRPPGTFEMASRLSSQSRFTGTSMGPSSLANPSSFSISSHLSANNTQSPPTAARPTGSHVQFQGLSSDIPIPINKSTPINSGLVDPATKRLSQSPRVSNSTGLLSCRDGGIDPQYLESNDQPSKPYASSSGGGGSSLMFSASQNASQRSRGGANHSSSTSNLPMSFPQSSADAVSRTLQAPLASAYFPTKAS